MDDILDYIGSYDDVRAVLGLNSQELPDTTLALAVYKYRLSVKLREISGTYKTLEGFNLETILGELGDEDELSALIKLFSVYSVADTVLHSIGLRAYKTISDGKSNITRFSPESTYKDTVASVGAALDESRTSIKTLLGIDAVAPQFISVVTPDSDVILGDK